MSFNPSTLYNANIVSEVYQSECLMSCADALIESSYYTAHTSREVIVTEGEFMVACMQALEACAIEDADNVDENIKI